MSNFSNLIGKARTPGVPIPPEIGERIPQITKICNDFGLDFPPYYIQMVNLEEICEIAAYGGFPSRYPYWEWGMEYHDLLHNHLYNYSRIYEMVINTTPSVIYCLNSNTLTDNITVIFHALGHAHFFKNNIFFKPTSQNMLNDLANNGSRIRRYMARWGKEPVTELIDYLMRIRTLSCYNHNINIKEMKDVVVSDSRNFYYPERIKTREGHGYMEPYINPPEWIDEQYKKIKEKEVAENIGIETQKTRDIFGFIKDHAPLKNWQSDIASMLYEEEMYFMPQRMTKTINEGFASYVDHCIMARMGYASLGLENCADGIVEYAIHRAGVLGGKYSMNPYKLGFTLLTDIEERWNKGRFGEEYDNCKNLKEKEEWDKNLGLGKEKVFEVVKYYNDAMLISEFFTEEFCHKNEFYEYKLYPNGEYKIENRDFKKIKKKIMDNYVNFGLPDIYLADSNHHGKGHLFLQHNWDGKILHKSNTVAVLNALFYFWKNDVYLASRNEDGVEIIYGCCGLEESDVTVFTRDEYLEIK